MLLQLLARFQVQEIVRLVVSHNHDDHVGGAVGILTAYEGRIEKICFLEDGELHQTKFWRKIEQQRGAGIITYDNLLRLECDDTPKMLYQERARKLSLKIFSPRFGDNLQAIGEGNPNATSGVLVLTIEDKRIVFAGDSTIRQWKRIREARGSRSTAKSSRLPTTPASSGTTRMSCRGSTRKAFTLATPSSRSPRATRISTLAPRSSRW